MDIKEIEIYLTYNKAVHESAINFVKHTEEIEMLDYLLSRIKELKAELSNIDELLARRDALDGEPKRYNKIMKAIDTARNVDSATIRVKELEEEVLRIIRKEFKQICCYCGWESKEGQWEELQTHLIECKQHPLYKALKRIKELEAKLFKIKSNPNIGKLITGWVA